MPESIADERIVGRVLDASGRVIASGLTLRDGIVVELHGVDADGDSLALGEGGVITIEQLVALEEDALLASAASASAGASSDDGLLGDEFGGDAGENSGTVIFPGFVDVHNHGGAGASFPDDTDFASIERAAAAHARGGTMTLVASLVSMTDPFPAIKALVNACEVGVIQGIHLEGPYVNLEKRGAQNPDAIRPIDLDELARMLEAGEGWIRSMTLAPELENAVEAAEVLLRAGARPSWGHTAATGERAREVLEATVAIGRRLGIALNRCVTVCGGPAMPPLHHRVPGPVLEFLAAARRGDAVVEVIGDGAHLDLGLVREILEALDDAASGELGGAALITDAMAAAGMPDGSYSLGALDVTVRDGSAFLTGTDTLAGGTSTLGDPVITLIGLGMDAGVLARAACGNPARALGLPQPAAPVVGELFRGVVVTGNELRVYPLANT